jgi:hypothetical protein
MNILLPTNEDFVESIAKSIGRERLFREASEVLNQVGVILPSSDELESKFDVEFEHLWNHGDDACVWNKESYCADALAAINKINLLLLMMPS